MGTSMTNLLPGIKTPRRSYRIVLTLAAVTILTACIGSDHSDLVAYVKEVNSRQKSKIEPLPTFAPLQSFSYENEEQRDPFEESAFIEQQRDLAAQTSGGVQPPVREIKEPLEEYPLDTLRMVGTLTESATLDKAETLWALIKDGEGAIHRVKSGNYMGRNYGKIKDITEHQVELLEIVPNGLGAYIEREAVIALSEGE